MMKYNLNVLKIQFCQRIASPWEEIHQKFFKIPSENIINKSILPETICKFNVIAINISTEFS